MTLGTQAATLSSTGNAAITFAATTGTISGGQALTVTTGGIETFGGGVGSPTPLASLTTNGGGTTQISGGSVTTSGNQSYVNAVKVTAGADLHHAHDQHQRLGDLW